MPELEEIKIILVLKIGVGVKNIMPKKIIIFIAIGLFFVLVLAELFIFNHQASFSHGAGTIDQNFEIKSGEGVQVIGQNLESAQLVRSKYYFDYYIWKTGSRGKIKAGKYELRGSMTIPEIVQVLSLGEIVSNEVKVTFPEGMSLKEMADILTQKGFNGGEFLADTDSVTDSATNFSLLKDVSGKTGLEGFLFPDTYVFFKDAKPENIVNRMLANFDEKITPKMREDIKSQGKTIYQIVTMASILEKEVKTSDDMKIVSGIFWNRLENDMPLQSDATIEYILGNKDLKHSISDTKIDNPYNTYKYKSLPPGPIDNPGLAAIQAAIYPEKTDYFYFLSDPATGKTIFAKTLEEHTANKVKYGL